MTEALIALFDSPGFTLVFGAAFGSLTTSLGVWIGGRRA